MDKGSDAGKDKVLPPVRSLSIVLFSAFAIESLIMLAYPEHTLLGATVDAVMLLLLFTPVLYLLIYRPLVRSYVRLDTALEENRKSEERYRELVEYTDAVHWTLDLGTGLFTYMSPQIERITGYPAAEWQGFESWAAHLHPDDREWAVDFCMSHTKRGEDHDFTYRVVTADGRIVWLRDFVNVITKDGKPVGLRGIMLDITLFKQTEAALEKSEENYRLLVENQNDLVVKFDAMNHLVFASPSYCRTFGLKEEDVSGMQFFPMIHEDDREKVKMSLQNLFQEPHTTYHEERAMTVNGWRWFGWSAKALTDGKGIIREIVSVGRDITEQKLAEKLIKASEEKYKLLFENSPLPMWVCDCETLRFLAVNNTAVTAYGYSTEEFLSMTMKDVEFPEDAVKLQRNQGMARDAYLFESLMLRHRRKNGNIFFAEIYSHPLVYEGKKAFFILAQDVTERYKLQEKIIRGKEEWEQTFDSVQDPIMILDPSFRITRVNRAMAELIGIHPAEALGMLCYQAVHKADSPVSFCPHLQMTSDGKSHTAEFHDNVRGRIYLITLFPILTGEVLKGAVHVMRDITEWRRTEELLRNAQKMETIGKLAGGVAHEVRNPLNSIMAITDALSRDLGTSAEYSQFLYHMRSQVDRLSSLMEDLLELGRPVERSVLRNEVFDQLCASAISIWSQGKYGVRYRLRVDKQVTGDLLISADSKRLQQVLINLFDNAAQNSPEDSEIRIEISCRDQGTLRVRIIDRGSGIHPDDLSKVFDTFFSTRRSGTGLGLSIVKHIIEMHSGSVGIINNDPPPGCTVEILLPLLREVET